ncbi:MAG: alkaline phosphatase family protein, partial [Alphaproteobacteria bacterium]|nr:alkaline phosphatase family protein [Alphaproteobacteria bacterium]
GYQSHGATETCPGHSTILTGDHPTRTGIIANNWIDQSVTRDDNHNVYCAEDESVPGSTNKDYTVSSKHLRVPTLGDRLKALNPASRVVAVSGKDRAAVMMSGHHPDEIWWWTSRNGLYQFTSYDGRTMPAAVATANTTLDAMRKSGYSYPLPDACKSKIGEIDFGNYAIGVPRPAMTADDPDIGKGLFTHPMLDKLTLDAGLGLIKAMKLGQGSAPDVLALGLSVTDPVGHAFGTQGPEMCAQLLTLDQSLGNFLNGLDATGVPYLLVLTADHGDSDIPERKGAPADSRRIASNMRLSKMDFDVGDQLHIDQQLFLGDNDFSGNIYLSKALSPTQRQRAKAAAIHWLMAAKDANGVPWTQTVLTRQEILAAPRPTAPPSEWTIAQKVAASYDPARSGDLYAVMKKHVMVVSDPGPGYVMAHGSVWNYDRRVPILFYGQGIKAARPSDEIETVDIMPTLAAMVGLKLAAGSVDGKCLRAVAGETCAAE